MWFLIVWRGRLRGACLPQLWLNQKYQLKKGSVSYVYQYLQVGPSGVNPEQGWFDLQHREWKISLLILLAKRNF